MLNSQEILKCLQYKGQSHEKSHETETTQGSHDINSVSKLIFWLQKAIFFKVKNI